MNLLSFALTVVSAFCLAGTACGQKPPPAYEAASAAYDAGEWQKAIKLFTEAAKVSDDPAIMANRGNCYSTLGNLKAALEDYEVARRQMIQQIGNPADARLAYIYFNQARAYELAKQYKEAIQDYEKTISLNGSYRDAKNNLGWILSTCPKAEFRNPKRAIVVAQLECEQTRWKDGFAIDTLAAAYAADGDFRRAVQLQKLAISLIKQERVLKNLNARLELYLKNQPFIDRDS